MGSCEKIPDKLGQVSDGKDLHNKHSVYYIVSWVWWKGHHFICHALSRWDMLDQTCQFRSFCFVKKMQMQNIFSCIYVGKMLIYVGNFFFTYLRLNLLQSTLYYASQLTCMHFSVWAFKAPISSVEIETYLSTIFCYSSWTNVIARTSDVYQYRTGSPQQIFYLLASVSVNPFGR